MHCTCVRHTELPHTSSLFADVLYHPDRTAPFYDHPFRELTSYQESARQVYLSDSRRAELIAALSQQNPASLSLERVAQRIYQEW
jgi:predicted transcriptional regulator